MRPDILVIFAKWPAPGQVKTRLCPPLSLEQAAKMAEAFLKDTIDRVTGLEDVEVWVAFTPAHARENFRLAVPASIHLLPQRGTDLGRRESNAFGDLLPMTDRAVAILGSDVPTVPLAFLREGFSRLTEGQCDVVLGPSSDGGYYFIGGRGFFPALFEGIDWSTPNVLHQTLDQAKSCNLRTYLLPLWDDIDTPADLQRLRQHLRKMDTALHVPRTRAFLNQLNKDYF